jgi:putative intracellular protease/amidase
MTPDSTLIPHQTLPSCLVIPGGAAGAEAMRSSPEVRSLIKQLIQAGQMVAAICAGTTVLVEAGDEAGWACDVVGHPSVREEVRKKGWTWVEDERVCVREAVGGGKGTVVTSIG